MTQFRVFTDGASRSLYCAQLLDERAQYFVPCTVPAGAVWGPWVFVREL